MMVDIATPEHSFYPDVSRFARATYRGKLNADICAAPDAFAYALEGGLVAGCFGLYRARAGKELLLETYVPDAFRNIAGSGIERSSCAELGTRAVLRAPGFRSADISLALAARLVVHAHAAGIVCLGFTSNRTIRPLARALGIELVELGEPDLSRMDLEFRANWERFFRVRQRCFGFRVDSPAGCLAALRRVNELGIRVALPP